MRIQSIQNTCSYNGPDTLLRSVQSSFNASAALDVFENNRGMDNAVMSPLGLVYILFALLQSRAINDKPAQSELKVGLQKMYGRQQWNNLSKEISFCDAMSEELNDDVDKILPYESGKASESDRKKCAITEKNAFCFSNMMFVYPHGQLEEKFESTMRNKFNFLVEKLDFSDAEKAASEINKAAAETSEGKISKIIASKDLSDLTRLVLLNSLYFKGLWKTPADKRLTKPGTFVDSLNSKRYSCHMMQFKGKMRYIKDRELGVEAVSLAIKDSPVSMLVIKPINGKSIRQVGIDFFTQASQQNLLNKMRKGKVYLQMPRFEMDKNVDLVEFSQSLGIEKIFSRKGYLTGIYPDSELYVDVFKQKAKIEVSESGVEAAAVTVAVINSRSQPLNVKEVTMDEPFLAILYHEEAHQTLIFAKVQQPVLLDQENASTSEIKPAALIENSEDEMWLTSLAPQLTANFVISQISSNYILLSLLKSNALAGDTRAQVIDGLAKQIYGRLNSDVLDDRQRIQAMVDNFEMSVNTVFHKNSPLEPSQDIAPNCKKTENSTLCFSNLMVVQDNYSIKNEFTNSITQRFNFQVKNLNFRDAATSAKAINQWTSLSTNGTIESIIEPSSITPDLRLCLLNAIYFKAKWEKEFSTEGTSSAPFTLKPSSETIQVNMMHQRGNHNYLKDDENGVEMLAKDFKDGSYDMVFVKPAGDSDLIKIGNLYLKETEKFKGLLNRMTEQDSMISIPRFKIENQIDLKKVSKAYGITDLFTTAANMTGISDDRLYISKFVQKALLDVNEGGVEAAALSFISLSVVSMPGVHFVLDEPFYVLLRHKPTNTVLFFARITRP